MNGYLIAEHQPRLIHDSGYRCVVCGRGPVLGGAYGLGLRCLNCSSYQGVSEPFFDLSRWIKEVLRSGGRRIRGLLKGLKERIFPEVGPLDLTGWLEG